ncbi:hypothetical protein DL766_008814 [Monosporascus sp. MC13-8B]|nr:hypothetical protein DL763_008823 [Monosporascus cannonballus]RYP17795.1 hypothetical protein DL766_008814 [Monosporascus sp. MC13-8B]
MPGRMSTSSKRASAQATRRGTKRQPAWMRTMPEAALQPGSGQLVLVEKKEDMPTKVNLSPKIPFGERVNPLIKPTDEAFMERERYFEWLLRSVYLTIEDILEANFDEHEIALFTPASGPPDIVKSQKDHSIRHQRLLDTVFKDKVPSPATKMAMLWFGLPVAPMKIGLTQDVTPSDLDFLEDQVTERPDPLKFLENFTVRTFGDPTRSVKSTEFFKTAPTQEFTSLKASKVASTGEAMSLRGGSLETLPGLRGRQSLGLTRRAFDYDPYGSVQHSEDEDDDDTPERQLKLEAQQALVTADASSETDNFTVLGYQGAVLSPRDYRCFVAAVDLLLGMRWQLDYDIYAGFFELHSDGSPKGPTAVEWVKGKVYHEEQKSLSPIHSALKKYINMDPGVTVVQQTPRYAVFVHYAKEDHPSAPEPVDDERGYVVNVVEGSTGNTAYMRLPGNVNSRHKPNQYSGAYADAIKVLFPEPPKVNWTYEIQSRVIGAMTPGHSFGWLDPPPAVWERFSNFDKPRAIELKTTDRYIKNVPILVSGFHSYGKEYSKLENAIAEDGVEVHKNDSEDRKNLTKVWEAVQESNPALGDYKDLEGLDVWIPGEQFLAPDVKPGRISKLQHPFSQIALDGWRTIVHGYDARHHHAGSDNLSIVARPVFKEYRLRPRPAAHNGQWFDIDINKLTLAQFREFVQEKVFSRWKEDPELCLYMMPGTWQRTQVTAAIRPETTEEEWTWIVRHITEPDIVISLQSSWENGWKNFQWGPRYDRTKVLELSSYKESGVDKVKDTQHTQPRGTKFCRGSNTRSDAASASNFITALDNAFNPTKPAMPLHGAPVESVIRTGPYMPGITIAMRTPTEVARLQREVHSLRNQLLDRTRECPYADCRKGPFSFEDAEGLDQHLREEHRILKCFLCITDETLLPHYDQQSIRNHFMTRHYSDLKELFSQDGVPQGTKGNEKASNEEKLRELLGANALDTINKNKPMLFHFCDRCGRDQFLLEDPADRRHHDKVCKVRTNSRERTDNILRDTFCKFCGRKQLVAANRKGYTPCKCGQKKKDAFDPGNVCSKCGLNYADEKNPMARPYREIHETLCRKPSGDLWQFCGFCGFALLGAGDMAKRNHLQSCEQRPRLPPVECPLPGGGEAKPLKPEEAVVQPEEPTKSQKKTQDAKPEKSKANDGYGEDATKRDLNGKQTKTSEELRKEKERQEEEARGAERVRRVQQQLARAAEPEKTQKEQRTKEKQKQEEEEEKEKQEQELAALMLKHADKIAAWKVRTAKVKAMMQAEAGQKAKEVKEKKRKAAAPLWREPKRGERVPPPRAESPDWEASLGPSDPTYWPPPGSRCSRCFRAASDNKVAVQVHMRPDGACKIRRGRGHAGGAFPLPNHSAWIEPSSSVDFKEAFKAFTMDYPAYRYTMFPQRDNPETVKKVYYGQNLAEDLIGDDEDDPNNRHEGNPYDAYDSGSLPWPPYPGAVIPVDGVPPPEEEEQEDIYNATPPKRNKTLHSRPNVISLDANIPKRWERQAAEVDYSQTETPTSTEGISTSEFDDSELDDDDGTGRRRKRPKTLDGTYKLPSIAEIEPSEEHSESGAIPETPSNLKPDAPPTPRKRSSGKKGRKSTTSKPRPTTTTPEKPAEDKDEALRARGSPTPKPRRTARTPKPTEKRKAGILNSLDQEEAPSAKDATAEGSAPSIKKAKTKGRKPAAATPTTRPTKSCPQDIQKSPKVHRWRDQSVLIRTGALSPSSICVRRELLANLAILEHSAATGFSTRVAWVSLLDRPSSSPSLPTPPARDLHSIALATPRRLSQSSRSCAPRFHTAVLVPSEPKTKEGFKALLYSVFGGLIGEMFEGLGKNDGVVEAGQECLKNLVGNVAADTLAQTIRQYTADKLSNQGANRDTECDICLKYLNTAFETWYLDAASRLLHPADRGENYDICTACRDAYGRSVCDVQYPLYQIVPVAQPAVKQREGRAPLN